MSPHPTFGGTFLSVLAIAAVFAIIQPHHTKVLLRRFNEATEQLASWLFAEKTGETLDAHEREQEKKQEENRKKRKVSRADRSISFDTIAVSTIPTSSFDTQKSTEKRDSDLDSVVTMTTASSASTKSCLSPLRPRSQDAIEQPGGPLSGSPKPKHGTAPTTQETTTFERGLCIDLDQDDVAPTSSVDSGDSVIEKPNAATRTFESALIDQLSQRRGIEAPSFGKTSTKGIYYIFEIPEYMIAGLPSKHQCLACFDELDTNQSQVLSFGKLGQLTKRVLARLPHHACVVKARGAANPTSNTSWLGRENIESFIRFKLYYSNCWDRFTEGNGLHAERLNASQFGKVAAWFGIQNDASTAMVFNSMTSGNGDESVLSYDEFCGWMARTTCDWELEEGDQESVVDEDVAVPASPQTPTIDLPLELLSSSPSKEQCLKLFEELDTNHTSTLSNSELDELSITSLASLPHELPLAAATRLADPRSGEGRSARTTREWELQEYRVDGDEPATSEGTAADIESHQNVANGTAARNTNTMSCDEVAKIAGEGMDNLYFRSTEVADGSSRSARMVDTVEFGSSTPTSENASSRATVGCIEVSNAVSRPPARHLSVDVSCIDEHLTSQQAEARQKWIASPPGFMVTNMPRKELSLKCFDELDSKRTGVLSNIDVCKLSKRLLPTLVFKATARRARRAAESSSNVSFDQLKRENVEAFLRFQVYFNNCWDVFTRDDGVHSRLLDRYQFGRVATSFGIEGGDIDAVFDSFVGHSEAVFLLYHEFCGWMARETCEWGLV